MTTDKFNSALNVTARRVLLDALEALASQRDALVIVGAQAVYLRTQHVNFSVAAYTRDGDLGLNPTHLSDEPLIEAAMKGAGFRLGTNANGTERPGLWLRTENVDGSDQDMEVDLMLPAAFDLSRRTRSVELPPHDSNVARQTPGLEAAVIDCDLMEIASLEPDFDPRRISVNVAGVAALLVAKAHKINDRLIDSERRADRLSDKDAGDIVRLMRSGNVPSVRATFGSLVSHAIAGPATRVGLELLGELFGAARAPGVEMAVRALASGDLSEDEIRVLCPAYVRGVSQRLGEENDD